MLSPAIYLLLNGLFFTLRLSGGGGSFVKSNMVYRLCKHMVYTFSLGSSTKR